MGSRGYVLVTQVYLSAGALVFSSSIHPIQDSPQALLDSVGASGLWITAVVIDDGGIG